jgi:hypothetical protein
MFLISVQQQLDELFLGAMPSDIININSGDELRVRILINLIIYVG